METNAFIWKDEKMQFFRIFLLFLYWLKSLLTVAKTEKKSRAIFQDFSPRKRTSGSTENLEIIFFKSQTKHVAQSFQGLWLLRLASERHSRRPIPTQKRCFLGSSCNFSRTTLNSSQQKIFDSYVFVKVSEKRHFEIFGRSVGGYRYPNVIFPG